MSGKPDQSSDWLDAWKPIFVNRVIPSEFKAAIQSHLDATVREARIDELKLITKDTFDKPLTPENQNDKTWQGGYGFAKNSLKRYKLERLRQLKGRLTKDKEQS
jgi:hypothetical protein